MGYSVKGKELLDLHKAMAWEARPVIDTRLATNNLELRAYRDPIRNMFKQFDISSLLDYGSAANHYELPGFDGDSNAKEFFELTNVFRYVPSREIDQRCKADAVLSFGLLERLFIVDLPATVREMFSLADRLLVVNIACYAAQTLLPNGDDLHVTVRPAQCWKGLFDSIAVEFPNVSVWLICSTSWRNPRAFEVYSAMDWLNSPTFTTTK